MFEGKAKQYGLIAEKYRERWYAWNEIYDRWLAANEINEFILAEGLRKVAL